MPGERVRGEPFLDRPGYVNLEGKSEKVRVYWEAAAMAYPGVVELTEGSVLMTDERIEAALKENQPRD